MPIQLQIQGIKQVNHFLISFPKTMNNEMMTVANQFMKDVQKSAKLRAPRFTGYLASSIFIRKLGKNSVLLEATAPWAAKMEFGKGLPQYVPISELVRKGWAARSGTGYVTASRTKGQRMIKGSLAPKKGYFRVTHYKPFIQPALEKNLSNLPNLLQKGVKNAIQKARK